MKRVTIAARTVALLCLWLFLAGVVCAADDRQDQEPGELDSLEDAGFSPNFKLRGFADVMMSATRTRADGSEDDATEFTLGELDLFITSSLSDRLNFLAETVFEIEDDGHTIADIERLFVSYSFSDRLRVSLGRRHTPLGYWNENFHHGLFLQPTVERPAALRFEDKGGILPIHDVGLRAEGALFRGGWMMDYALSLSNGRGYAAEEIQSLTDRNDTKAMAGKLSFGWTGKTRIQFGPMFYSDTIPADPDPAGRQYEIDESIVGAHFVLQSEDLEIISEYYHLSHDSRLDQTKTEHDAFYAIAIWKRWRWKPYLGYDRWELDPLDPFFADRPAELERFQAGARYDINGYSALKLELRHEDQPDLETNDLLVQLALAF